MLLNFCFTNFIFQGIFFYESKTFIHSAIVYVLITKGSVPVLVTKIRI